MGRERRLDAQAGSKRRRPDRADDGPLDATGNEAARKPLCPFNRGRADDGFSRPNVLVLAGSNRRSACNLAAAHRGDTGDYAR